MLHLGGAVLGDALVRRVAPASSGRGTAAPAGTCLLLLMGATSGTVVPASSSGATVAGRDTTLVPRPDDLGPCWPTLDLGMLGGMGGTPSTPELVFAASPVGLRIFHRLRDLVADLPDLDIRVTTSQVALWHSSGFAYLWYPGRYVRSEVPAVLSLALPAPADSPRVKQVGHPSPGVWMHHFELGDPDQLDEEMAGWLRTAYDAAR